mmetsp:Transcript_44901/g.108974  ORF Transcript_44901/g.108974 Transcript_44901/m.108974 type:complete len:690 (+) Transcript_44901:38-2107(+)
MAKKEPEIIDLLDSDDDSDDDNGAYPPTATAAAAAKSTTAAAAGTKRPRSEFAAAADSSSSSNIVKREAKSHKNYGRITHTTSSRRIPGCMLRPKPSPIKLFATRQDEQLRETLPSNALSQKHWSLEHCWTLREMMGLDRFSGLLTEKLPVSVPSGSSSGTTTTTTATAKNNNSTVKKNSGCGIDWCLITTYLLNVSDLLEDLKELFEIPNVVVVYEYMESERDTDQLSSLRALQNPEPQDHNSSCLYWKRLAQEHIRKMVAGSTTTTTSSTPTPKEDIFQRFRGVTFIKRTPKDEPFTGGNPTKTRMRYGCHHTKMFIIGYSSGRLRVNIHTSNLSDADTRLKCNGAFIQDFLPKSPEQLFEPPSDFEEALVSYLESYALNDTCQWRVNDSSMTVETMTSHLQSYDFSTACGVIVPSVPGNGHSPTTLRDPTKQKQGYLKLSQAIREFTPKPDKCRPRSNPLIFQFSSFSTTHESYLDKLVTAWDVDSVHYPSGSQNPYSKIKKPSVSSDFLRIVWPTRKEIANSVEGPLGGGSAPAKQSNVQRPYLQKMFHRWTSSSSKGGEDPYYKGCNVPHIKTFYQIDSSYGPNSRDMKWFCITSHNISKAAWGEIQNRQVEGTCLSVQHWELGVFVSPATLGVQRMGVSPMKTGMGNDDYEEDSSTERATIPLPYKFRPDPYIEGVDQPWYTY